MKPTASVLILVLSTACAAQFTAVDSLLEEAKFQYQIKGDPDRAMAAFETILSDFPGDTHAVAMAKKGLLFCRRATGRAVGADSLESGRSGPGAGAPPLLLWRQAYGAGNITGAAQDDSLLALTTEDGFLFVCRPRDGTVIWARRGISGLVPPAVSDRQVFVQAKNGLIHALSEGSGKILWSAASGPLTAPLVAAQRRLLFGASGKRAFALNLQSGAKVWERDLACDNWISQPPAVCGSIVVFRAPGRGMAALSLQSGAVEWQSEIEADLPALGLNGAVVAVSGASVYALDPETGKMLWNLSLGAPAVSAAHEEGLGIVVLDNAGGVTGLDPATGARRFAFMGRPGRCIVHGGRITIADRRGRIGCYSGDGRLIWEYATGEMEHAEPVILKAGLGVMTESSGFFMLNSRYDRKEDGRLAAGRLEAGMLLKGGMNRSAELKIQHLLNDISPGDPPLILQYAVLLQNQGKRAEAMAAWERYVNCADPGEIGGPGNLKRLKELSSSSWTAYIEAAGKFSPLYSAGGRIAVLGQGEADVLDAQSGERVWRYRLRSPDLTFQTAAVDGERLYCFGGQELYCLDVNRQKEIWRVPLPVNVTQIAVSGGRLAVGTWNDGCIFINRATGQTEAREFKGLKALFPFAAENDFTCISLEGVIIRMAGRQILEQVSLGDKIASLPVFFADAFILQTARGQCLAFSSRTGRKLLEFRTGSPLLSVAADGERLYLIFSNQVYGSLKLSDGRRIWQKREEEGQYEGLSCAGGRLAVYGGNRVFLCSAETGEKMQAFQIVGRISSVIFEEGMLIVRGENGLLYRFEVRQ